MPSNAEAPPASNEGRLQADQSHTQYTSRGYSDWLRQAVAHRLAELGELSTIGYVTITPLVPSGGPGSRSDRTCDRCDTYAPEGTDYYPFAIRPRALLVVVVGLCERCIPAEGGQR